MPKIYLSPSTQESNPYITGSGSEEYNMNRLADALEPYLYANGIRFVRNTPDMTAASSIAQANRLGGFDFYLALHSNAAAPANAGNVRGVLVFYYPTSAEGKRAADLFAANLKRVYPLPDLVRTVPTTALGEVRQPKYPANLLELGYHDNSADAAWVENNMDAIARELARSLTSISACRSSSRSRSCRGLSPRAARRCACAPTRAPRGRPSRSCRTVRRSRSTAPGRAGTR